MEFLEADQSTAREPPLEVETAWQGMTSRTS